MNSMDPVTLTDSLSSAYLKAYLNQAFKKMSTNACL